MGRFDAYYKPNGCLLTVYDIRYDKSGYPHFLVHINGEWRILSAKLFGVEAYTAEMKPSVRYGTTDPIMQKECKNCGSAWDINIIYDQVHIGRKRETFCPVCGHKLNYKDGDTDGKKC